MYMCTCKLCVCVCVCNLHKWIPFQWEDQHEGISCDQFSQWKADNDPEAQRAGLAAVLKENGIGKYI